ncbi:MAG: cyclic nucleotide-binding domain-containing protein, partial [Nocardioidaceae bacterium]
ASPFPRHWIYDESMSLVSKTGSIDFAHWYREMFGKNTPWGDSDSPAFAVEAETALERAVSLQVMRGGKKPVKRKIDVGQTLVQQGDQDDELFLLLDGVLDVEVDGEVVAQVGPGAILGERAVLEGGSRTSTLRAVTPSKVAVAAAEDLDLDVLREISAGHRREARADQGRRPDGEP